MTTSGIATPLMARVGERSRLMEETSLLRLDPLPGHGLPVFQAGQFFQLSVPGGGEAPFSPVTLPPAGSPLTFCIRRVGHVTSLLHELRPGDPVGIRGPFGRGFPLERLAGRPVIVMAGGLGIVPLKALLEALGTERGRYGAVTLLYGARTPSHLLFADELRLLGTERQIRVLFSADFVDEEAPPPFACRAGLVHQLLQAEGVDTRGACAVLCGPPPLYRCLVPLLSSLGVCGDDIFLSLERRMECGMGRCCHCGIGTFLCCTDGPVFSVAELAGLEDAL